MLSFIIAFIWLANGLFCKVMNLVPRHELIVARILGNEYASVLTRFIGVTEILMAIWIISARWRRINAIVQIIIITIMNTLELILAPDLLLFGKFNGALALLLILVIYWNEFQATTIKAR